ncbi:lysophospholipid acyltransferase family protein [Spongiivirga sp. MCCC 1A20706]|uniref:lysophospholipid acyltransferase family protein n=1 Tax=Spongiivirga sp. MCCC 1A20706 TaxID=3160963 RepID=UPI003977296F
MQAIARFIYFKLLGWKLEGEVPNISKCVMVVAPHTHWLDFLLGLLIRAALKEEINFIGKESLFKPPFGWFFRWMGGAPIARSKKKNQVQQIVEIFESKSKFRLALAPEGTRKKVDEWKTGFYYIAKAAKVPVIKIAFDFGKKTIKIADPVKMTDNMEADIAEIMKFYEGVKGKIPKYS